MVNNDLAVHVTPLVLVAMLLDVAAENPCIATNVPWPYLTLDQLPLLGSVDAVHVIPSKLYAAEVPPWATATNRPLP